MSSVLRRHRLIETDWPSFGMAARPADPPASEFSARLDAARGRMLRAGLTHLAVYADREHFANLAWLTGFDPRFEEALLVLRPEGSPLLLTGNECMSYLPVSPLYREGLLRAERYQSFSLLNQDRSASRPLLEILRSEGIGEGSRVGATGWKYFAESELPGARHALDIPAFLADALRSLAGHASVTNETALFMSPDDGLRSTASPSDIAYFEYTNTRAAEGMKRMLFAVRDGIEDFELAKLIEYSGEPLGCHMTLKSAGNRISLASPRGGRILRGGPMSSNICYWGANICRAGWVAETPADLPEGAADYTDAFAGPYFSAIGEWLSLLRIGQTGGVLHQLIQDRLPFDRYKIFLNAGHLIHLDEWVSSPIFPGSTLPIRSGMVLQTDVIPSHPIYYSTRIEEGVAICDATLRRELAERFPQMWARCESRRRFAAAVLGIELPVEVVPLSNTVFLVPPFFLNPRRVFALE